MSSAALAYDTSASNASKSRSNSSSATVRVNTPGDLYEHEADRVADRVSRGERISGWSLSSTSLGRVQRQTVPPPDGQTDPSKPLSKDDMIKKVGEALLQTKEGKAAVNAIKRDPLVKSTIDFFSTPAGIVIGGAAATGVVAGLAAAKQPLPMQIPKLPLDFIHPGLGIQLKYEGPVNHPSAAFITLSFTPTAKKTDDRPNYRAEADQIRASLDMFHDKHPGHAQDNPAQGAVAIPQQQGSASPKQPVAAAPPVPDVITGADAAAKPEDKKREEPDVQRKAEVTPDAGVAHTGGVGDVLSSHGRPLDTDARQYMESHIGFDFRNVRVFTDSRAAVSARSLKARAYTVGSNIVFAPGMFKPETSSGRKLLAHELTHVVQQSPAEARKPAGITPAPRKVQRSSLLPAWAEEKIRKFPGYDLFCTLIGKDLTTWTDKPSQPKDILREIVLLVGGEEAWKRIEEVAGALESAWNWLKQELADNHLTLTDFKALVDKAVDSIHLRDLADIDAAVERVKGFFKPSYDAAIAVGKKAINKFFEIAVKAVMDTFGDTGRKVMEVINKAGGTFLAIAKAPLKFAGHLFDALKQGFTHFAEHFLKHLQDSLMDFLFGAVASKVKHPSEFSIPAIFNLALDVLGLNYDAFRERLVAKTSPEAVTVLERGYDVITKVASAKSLAGAWSIFKEQAGNIIDELVNTAIDEIKNWVLTRIVRAAIEKVISLFTPASALIGAVQAIYKTIVVLINKAQQLFAVLKAVSESIAKIVAGDISQAADFIESGMSRALNFLVAFFAGHAGVGGIGETIRGIIKKIRAKVMGVIDKVIDYILGKAKGLLARAKATAGKILAWWQQRKDMLIEGEAHAVYMEGSEDSPKLMIASDPISGTQRLAELRPKVKGKHKPLLDETVALVAKLEKPLDKNKSAGEKSEQEQAKRTTFDQVCKNIAKLGFPKQKPPVSKIKYDSTLTPEGGGTRATAKVLSANPTGGSRPSDKPSIWSKLGKLIRRKNYVRGHLMNQDLGGEGISKNLTPITKKTNSRHYHQVEKEIKQKINAEKKVVFYQVKAIYTPPQPHKPKPMIALEAENAKKELTGEKKELLESYQAEQKLAVGLEYKWHELQPTEDGKWEKVDSTGEEGGIPNQLDLEK